MPSPHTVVTATVTTSSSVRTAPTTLSSTPPATTALSSDSRFNSPSPKSAFLVPRAATSSSSTPPSSAAWGPYYASTSNNIGAAAAANIPPVYPNTKHIASAIAQPPSLQPQAFSAASLPRTSSLLPPPRIQPESSSVAQPSSSSSRPSFQNPFNANQPTESPPNDLDHLPPPGRANSAGGLSDGFRNLNRWSASSTSSRTSHANPQNASPASSRSKRRTSVDIIGGVVQGNSPRKLTKRPPSASGTAARSTPSTRVRRGSSVSVPPLQALPQIASLPPLDSEFQSAPTEPAASPEAQRAPSAQRTTGEASQFYQGNGSRTNSEDTSVLSAQVGSTGRAFPGSVSKDTKMLYNANGENGGHSRSRSAGTKGSGDSTSQSKSRDRSSKHPSQKAMLSKALQRANTAVQLDNAQNPEGARTAYSEACDLLQQVLVRTPGEEDRKKLEAIHKTYTSRIDELNLLIPEPTPVDKALPRRPEGNELQESAVGIAIDGEDAVIETATVTRVVRERQDGQKLPSYSTPTLVPRRPSDTAAGPHPGVEVMRDASSSLYLSDQQRPPLPNNASRQSSRRIDNGLVLQPTPHNAYMPPPLSPRRPYSPAKPNQQTLDQPPTRTETTSANRLNPSTGTIGHQRGNSHESISWLDPIDESGGSSASSVHSRSSSVGIRRKHIRAPSGNTEAEFDAALDDAIEAAYDDGYEPDSLTEVGRNPYEDEPEDAVAKALRRVQLARERVRESEREAMELANEREKRLRMQQQQEDEELRQQMKQKRQEAIEDFYDGNDSEEEERMLEEMTKGLAIEDFACDPKPQPKVPRESDSSWATGRTFHSSMGSTPPTATTILTTVSENTAVPAQSKPPSQRPPPPPVQALPNLPPTPLSAGSQSSSNSNGQGVRSRRLSGQNPKQLKIETSKLRPPAPATAGPTSTQPKAGGYIVQQRQALSAGPNRNAGPQSARPAPSPGPSGEPGTALPTPPSAFAYDGEGRSGSPSVSRQGLRKNFSSSSLRSMKSRNLSVSHLDDASDLSPGTPLSNQYGMGGSSARLPAMPSLPPPLAAAFKERANSNATGGLYLFESDFHSPLSPRSPNALTADTPAPLEHCPTEVMLRPFWLMRCLYQSLCHPRGGYISSKLFIPRDVWRVKGAKLKNLEDKIANCDLLTAALQKLSRVDTCDADAVLEEMQSLEGLLEQVQTALGRKLGNDVGVQGAGLLFKEAASASATDAESSSAVPRSASVSGKGGGFSWRRLRNKNSSAALGTSYSGKGSSGGGTSNATTPVEGTGAGGGKDAHIPSLPMTSQPTRRPAKRDISSVQFGGPNAQYMASLAKLFDAAQTVDQIARQVEDPGLRHADKTQVGLELCTRHAAEFFGFYICRFVLTDLMMLLDKFVKRGSEWALV